MSSTAELDPKLEPIVDKLVAQAKGRHDADFVRGIVREIASEFDGAPVQDYLAVLVAKEAGDELRRLRTLQPISA